MTLLLVLACAPEDDCEAMCVASRSRFEACMEERGLEWGASVGYESASDYDGWCATWTWEARQLDEAQTCSDRLAAFEDGDCDTYYEAWAE